MRHGLCFSACFAALLYGTRAHAQQTAEDIARRDLISQAEAARDFNDHPRALSLATRAAAIRMTPSLALLLAQEHGVAGHLIEALSFGAQCVRDAEADGDLRHRRRILTACNALIDTLSARLGRVTVHVPVARPPGFHVFVQHTELRESLWGVPYPVAPGSVTVEATATDGASFHQDLTFAPGESRDVTVSLVLPARPPPPPPTPDPSLARAEPPRPPRRLPGVGPYALAGAGVGVLGLAGLFYGLRELSVSDRDGTTREVSSRCNLDPLQCDYGDAASADGRARSFNLITNAMLGVGVVTVASGAIWWLVSYLRYPTPAVRVSVSAGASGPMLSLEGSL